MFTGIVTDVGTVRTAEKRGDVRLVVTTTYDLDTVDLGASIACSGACLTVADKGADWFAVDLSAETISKTAADHWVEGARLNLERSLRLGDEVGGHLVSGHVDGVGEVVEAVREGDSTKIVISVPVAFAPMIAVKGSVALDGVSMTVNELICQGDGSTRFSVNVIPHTARSTTLGDLAPGRQLNVEVDLLARYLERMMRARSQ